MYSTKATQRLMVNPGNTTDASSWNVNTSNDAGSAHVLTNNGNNKITRKEKRQWWDGPVTQQQLEKSNTSNDAGSAHAPTTNDLKKKELKK